MTKLAAAPMMFATCLAASAHAATFTFPEFTIPGASSVIITAINDSEQVAGFYVTATGTCCGGFTGKRGDTTILPNYPAPDGTSPNPTGIMDNGTVVGTVYTGQYNNFTWLNGKYTSIFGSAQNGQTQFPPYLTTGNHVSYNVNMGHSFFALFAGVLGREKQVTPSTGTASMYAQIASTNRRSDIAGEYQIEIGITFHHAVFFGTGEKVVPLLPSGATSSAGGWLNDLGQVAGSYKDSGGLLHGFIHEKGVFTTFDMPVKPQTLTVQGIDLSGRVVGAYQDPSGHQHGFYYSHGVTKTLGSFASTDTVAVSISHLGHGIAMSVTTADNTATSYLVHCTAGPGAC